MSMQDNYRSIMRPIKVYTKGYSKTEVLVRRATCNDPWGPVGADMNAIAQLTYHQLQFTEIIEMLDKRLNDTGKNWRHVFKALSVLDYCLRAGSEQVVAYARTNAYVIKTLREFQYIDQDMVDQGANVRNVAKNIHNLLQDPDKLREARANRNHMKDRMTGSAPYQDALSGGYDDHDADLRPSTSASGYDRSDELAFRDPTRSQRQNSRRSDQERRPRRQDTTDEDQLRKALDASKASAAADDAKRERQSREDDEIAKAIALSRAEDERRKKELEEANARALFDDANQLWGTGPHMQQPMQQAVDFFGNPIAQMQTGYQHPMQTGLQQPMHTGFQQPMQTGFQQPMQTGFQQGMFTGMSNDPYALQQQQMLAEQQRRQREMEAQALQSQYQQMLAQQQQMQQQNTALTAQPTGARSNNPFAKGPTPEPSSMPRQYEPVPSSNPAPLVDISPQAEPSPSPAAPSRPPKSDGEYAHLAQLLASREGTDTFGNSGALRMPVGSGYHPSNRVAIQQTGLPSQPTGNPYTR